MNDFFKSETFVWIFCIVIDLLCGTASSIAASRKNRSSFWAFIGFSFPWTILILEALPTKKPKWLPAAANSPRLIKCPVCHGNMSSTADICPHCGNRNPENIPEKMGTIEWMGTFAGIACIIFYGLLLYSGNIYSLLRTEKYPKCDSYEAKHLASKTFKTIPLFKIAGTEIISWKSITTTEDSAQQRSCKAQVLLTTAANIDLLYDFHIEDGRMIIKVQPDISGLNE